MRIFPAMLLALGASCAPPVDEVEDPIGETFLADGKSDAWGVDDESPEGAGVLRLVNEADEATLDDDAALSAKAAGNIVKHRQGPDRRDGTDDDDLFDTLAELDAVPYVGKTSWTKLLAHARALGYVEEGPCADVGDWPAGWEDLETDVLERVNRERAAGASCGSAGDFEPAPPVRGEPALRCAARRHSIDMAARDFFDHVNPDGDGPSDRVTRAGYEWRAVGENIAAGQSTAASVVSSWMESDGHCANIMSPDFEELGVGYHRRTSGLKHYWTQAFGTPR